MAPQCDRIVFPSTGRIIMVFHPMSVQAVRSLNTAERNDLIRHCERLLAMAQNSEDQAAALGITMQNAINGNLNDADNGNNSGGRSGPAPHPNSQAREERPTQRGGNVHPSFSNNQSGFHFPTTTDPTRRHSRHSSGSHVHASSFEDHGYNDARGNNYQTFHHSTYGEETVTFADTARAARGRRGTHSRHSSYSYEDHEEFYQSSRAGHPRGQGNSFPWDRMGRYR